MVTDRGKSRSRSAEGDGDVRNPPAQTGDAGSPEAVSGDITATFTVAPLRRRPVAVYGGHAGSDLIFIEEARALDLANLYSAIDESRTWGELRERLSAYDFEQAVAQRRDAPFDEETLEALPPRDDEPFAREQLPWLEEYSWPAPAVEAQLEWLPSEVRELGDYHEGGMFSGDWLSFTEEAAKLAAVRLADNGYVVRRDDALCRAATGG